MGVTVDAIGTVEHSGKSTGVAVGSLVDIKTGKLYASSSTTCLVMTPELK
jgi:acyl-coenzyme A thioesterase PaaI-like protein